MPIYTRTGDAGQTGLSDGRRVSKDDLRIETCGTFDELNSVLGLAIAECAHSELRDLLGQLQRQLFDLGADLATPADAKNTGKVPRIGEEHVGFLERQIDAATALLPPLKHFVLPGGSRAAAALHMARTVCRRGERLLVRLSHGQRVSPDVLAYANRLSDLLFVLARRANQLDGVEDHLWQPDPPA